ncbi:MAG: hypothetical protein E6343_15185 [Clostridium perfringens]|nr:hypothetical protein [Clostridium perfringens]
MVRAKGDFRIKTEERIKFLLENGFENLKDDDKFSKLFLKMVTSEEELNNLKDWFLNKETKLKEKDVSPIITRLKPLVWNERVEKEVWGEKFDRSKFKGKLTFQERILNMIFDEKI